MEHIVPWIQVIGGSVVHVPLDPFELPIRCTRTPDGFILPGPVATGEVNARNVVEHEILDVHLRLYVRIVGRIRHVIRRDELFELRPGKRIALNGYVILQIDDIEPGIVLVDQVMVFEVFFVPVPFSQFVQSPIFSIDEDDTGTISFVVERGLMEELSRIGITEERERAIAAPTA